MNALLALKILDLAILAAQAVPPMVESYRRARTVLEACAAERRDPTAAELDALDAACAADRAALFSD